VRRSTWFAFGLGVLCTLLAVRLFDTWPQVAAQSPEAPKETPIGPPWWPSEWGADDQRGAANRLTPAKVREATGLIRTGQVVHLGRPYEYGMPLPGKRHFSLTIPGSPTGGPDGVNRVVHHDELFSGEIGQIGTQLDGLGHVGVRMGATTGFTTGSAAPSLEKRMGCRNWGSKMSASSSRAAC
jgi:hypothetical protein